MLHLGCENTLTTIPTVLMGCLTTDGADCADCADCALCVVEFAPFPVE